jgi:hypothetical protein
MDNLLLDLAAFTVGTHGLKVRAVLLSFSFDVDRSYVDGGSFVVSIINTTWELIIFRSEVQASPEI